MWVLVDLQASVTRAMRNLPKDTDEAPVVVVKQLQVGVIRLNLTFDKVKLQYPSTWFPSFVHTPQMHHF